MIDFQKLKEIVKNNHSFLITTHVNPDADAIGSEVAFSKILDKLGKKYKIINHSPTPYNLLFLDTEKIIEKYDPTAHDNYFESMDVLIALDFNRADRMVSMEKIFRSSSKLKVCIDHHQDPESFADYYFVDTSYSATGHILYDFINDTSIIIMDRETAAPIYTAIMTDTGSFRFDRTTPELHRVIADLLETGVSPSEIYNHVYDESKLSKIKLLGKSLSSLKLTTDNQIGYMIIHQSDFMELDALESDTDNFVNFILSIQGVVLGMLFIELKNGFKVSFRSKGKIPVNKFAGLFGGGGHVNAAGARFRDKNMSVMIPQILSEAEKFLNNYIKG